NIRWQRRELRDHRVGELHGTCTLLSGYKLSASLSKSLESRPISRGAAKAENFPGRSQTRQENNIQPFNHQNTNPSKHHTPSAICTAVHYSRARDSNLHTP